jgi:hypothetical protein
MSLSMKALAIENADLNFGHVWPTIMLKRMMKINFFEQSITFF